jgi:hypothetical protein
MAATFLWAVAAGLSAALILLEHRIAKRQISLAEDLAEDVDSY